MPEILPLTSPTPRSTVRDVAPSLLDARRAFAKAQELLAGGPFGTPEQLDVGWHDTTVNLETGSFAVVQLGAGLDDLLGEVVRVTFSTRVVYAYVIDIVEVPTQLSLTRRLFAALNRLTLESLKAEVVTVQ